MNLSDRLKKTLINTAVILISIMATLTVVELAVRAFAPQPRYYQPQYLFVADKDLGYRLNPGFIGSMQTPESRTNIRITSQGLRDDQEHAGAGKFVILGLGDSFTFGSGVELNDTYLARLERLLNEKSGGGFEVVKAGVPGYGTDQEFTYLRRTGMSFAPKLVIVGFYVNDVTDNITPDFTVSDGYTVPSDKTRESFKHKGISLKQRVARLMNALHTPSFIINRLSTNATFKKLFLSTVLKTKGTEGSRIDMYARTNSPEADRAWTATREYLKNMNDLVRRSGGSLLVLYIPERVQVYRDQWDAVIRQYRLDATQYDAGRPNRTVLDLCASVNAAFLDLTPAFRTAVEKGEDLYFTMDPHLNVRGHHFAAELIYAKLTADRLVNGAGRRTDR